MKILVKTGDVTYKETEGYECRCKRLNEYPIYVHAHWDVRLLHTCDCGRKNEILRGRIVKWGEKP